MEDQEIREPESEDETSMDDLEMAEADGPAAVTTDTPDLEVETEYEEEVDDIDADARGLALPKSVIDKIYYHNARREFFAKR